LEAAYPVGSTDTLARWMSLRQSSSEHWLEADFRGVFLEHYERMVAILVRLVGDRSQAEELTSDAFWRLYHQPSLQSEGNVGGWLYRTATNLGIDTLRARVRRREHEKVAEHELTGKRAGDPLHDLLREEKRQHVRTALALIKPAAAQLLILRASGLSYKELAQALNIKMSSIGTMLNRAEEEFRKRYLALHPHEEAL